MRAIQETPLLSVLAALTAFATGSPAAGAGPELSAEIEGGWQEVAGDTKSAKFDEYRDVREWIARGSFLLESESRRHYLRGWFSDVGQDDERYRLEGGRLGKWGLFGEFSELPHELSSVAQTPYGGRTFLTVPWDPSVPGFDLATAVSAALQPADLGFRTLTGEGGGFYRPTQELEFRTGYRLLDKHGRNFIGAMGAGFGGFAQFAAPVDEQIHEVTADVGWKGENWSTSFNYTGNIFDNDLGSSVTLDNPLVAAGMDTPGSSSRWRYPTAPDNQAHSFNLAGSLALPIEIPMVLTGTFSYGKRIQDESFIPMTINAVNAGDPRLVPSKSDLDGDVDILLGDVRLAVDLTPELDLDFHYRIYDYDNDSDTVAFEAVAVNDGSITDDAVGEPDRFSVPNEYLTQNASMEGSYRLREDLTFGFGWDWEQWQRSSGREVKRTNEQGPNAHVDYRPVSWAHLRASYSYTVRRRSSYRPFAWIEESYNPALVPGASGRVFPELRKFPQADRQLHESNLILQLLPFDDLQLNLNGGVSLADYDRSDFGLKDDEWWNVGGEVSYSPFSWLMASAYYSFDHGLTKQKSRDRLPDDPVQDWTSRTTERAHNAGLDVFAQLLPGRLDAEVRYDFQRGRVRTHSGGALLTDANNFPIVKNTLHVLATTLSYHLSEQLTLKAGYRLERYYQTDFEFDDVPFVIGSDIYLGNSIRDYKGHIYALSAVLKF